MKPVFMLLTKIKMPKLPGFLEVLHKYIAGMDGLWLKGMLCSYPLSCVHTQRKLQPNQYLPQTQEMFALYQLCPLVLMSLIHFFWLTSAPGPAQSTTNSMLR